MLIELPKYIPALTLALGFATLLFAYVRWEIDRRLKTQLATVLIAPHLETLSRQCFSVSIDDGTWNDPEHPDHPHGRGQNHNEAMVNAPDIPKFETFKDVSMIGLRKLDRLMSLRTIQISIESRLSATSRHDHPDYKDYFYERRLFYGALGLISAELALKLRLSVRSKGMRDTVANEREKLRKTLDDLADKAAHPEAWKDIYPRFCLYDETLYWPKAFKPFAPKTP